MALDYEDSGTLSAIGDRVERRLRLTAETIVAVAVDLGDYNPFHHDRELAKASRFGELIASASHTIGLLLGLGGSQASLDQPGVGLSFTFDLKSAAKAGDDLVIWWQITGAEPTRNGTNTLVHMNGGIDAADGRAILTATGTTMWFGRGPSAAT